MRLRTLLLALAFLALAACDSKGLLQTAQAPATPQTCCCQAAATACPPAAAPTPAVVQAPVMTPEPAVYVPPAPPKAVRHRAVRRVAHATHGERGYAEVREYAYAGGRPPAPAYDGYVEVPDRRIQGYSESVETQETYRERYSERSESSSGRYAERGGYESRGGRDCDCAPREAAGRDHYGFLTWPGKVPARP